MNYTEIEILRGIVKDELNVSTRTGIVDKVADGYVNVRIGHATVLRKLTVIGDISYLMAGSNVVVLSISGKSYCLSSGVFSGGTALPAGANSYSLGAQYYDKSEVNDLLERKSDSGHSHRYDHLEAVSGTVGGFEILADTIRSSAGNFALTSNADATRLVMGTADDIAAMDGKHATYRFWAGDANPALAPFSVEKDGKIHASAGDIAGWDILSDRLSKNAVELDPLGRITVGTMSAFEGTTIGLVDHLDVATDWRLWIGHENPAFAPFRVDKDGHVDMSDASVAFDLQSDNYEANVRGWKLDSTGWAELQDVVIRGRIEASIFAETTISAVSGQMVVSVGDSLIDNVEATATTILVGTNVLGINDIIQFKAGGAGGTSVVEWMRVETGAVDQSPDPGFEYGVERDLEGIGASVLESGTACVRKGTATDLRLAQPFASGEAEGAFGAMQPGGSGSASAGGWIVLDGAASSFSVITRQGPVWNQFQTTVRIGNLGGVLDYGVGDWGLFIGDDNDYMAYDEENGLRIQFIGSAYDTTISGAGFVTELAKLKLLSAEPAYDDGYAQLWFNELTGEDPRVFVKMKNSASEVMHRLGDMHTATYDTAEDGVVDNADQVDSIHAAATATANQLLALDGSAKLPASITGDAHTVDSLHGADLMLIDEPSVGVAVAETISGGTITVDPADRNFIIYAEGTGVEDTLTGVNPGTGSFSEGDLIIVRAFYTDTIMIEHDNPTTGDSGFNLPNGEDVYLSGSKFLVFMYRSTDFILVSSNMQCAIGFMVPIGGAGAAIQDGSFRQIRWRFDFELQAISIIADQSGTIRVELWHDTYANFPPTSADEVGSISLASATKGEDTALSGFTKTRFLKGEVSWLYVDGVATSVEQVGVELRGQRIG